ncbi:MAG: hypothetical protein QXP35_00330 [Candidatus Micrarchaeaceae archaeon]
MNKAYLLNQRFENEGLKIDKNRVIIYSQSSCLFNCKYCFKAGMNQNKTKNNEYLSIEQLNLLEKLPSKVNLIMLGCDTEFFHSLHPMKVLDKVSDLDKDISLISKIPLSKIYIEKIKQINEKLSNANHIFVFSISLPVLYHVKDFEPSSSDPYKRIESLKALHNLNIKTLVAIRPLLPNIGKKELEDIVTLTKDYCNGYYSGPLYVKNLEESLFFKRISKDLKIEKIQPHWMPQGNLFYKLEKPEQMELLTTIVQTNKKQIFEGAADAINYLKFIK